MHRAAALFLRLVTATSKCAPHGCGHWSILTECIHHFASKGLTQLQVLCSPVWLLLDAGAQASVYTKAENSFQSLEDAATAQTPTRCLCDTSCRSTPPTRATRALRGTSRKCMRQCECDGSLSTVPSENGNARHADSISLSLRR